MSENKNVTIYSTPSCIHCQHTKEFFGENNIDYTDYDVSQNTEKRQEMIEKSGQMGVPVISIDDEIVVGFDQSRLQELLGI